MRVLLSPLQKKWRTGLGNELLSVMRMLHLLGAVGNADGDGDALFALLSFDGRALPALRKNLTTSAKSFREFLSTTFPSKESRSFARLEIDLLRLKHHLTPLIPGDNPVQHFPLLGEKQCKSQRHASQHQPPRLSEVAGDAKRRTEPAK